MRTTAWTYAVADGPAAAIAAVWNRYWFTPTDRRPLALVRIGTAAVALALWWGYAADLQAWFGPAGEHFSIDRWLGDRAGRPAPGPRVRASIAGGLLKVHASAIAGAAVLAQLKGDAWWNGLAS
jgi:hypothetical protein